MSIVSTLSGNPTQNHTPKAYAGFVMQEREWVNYSHDWHPERCLYIGGRWVYPAQCCDAYLSPDDSSAQIGGVVRGTVSPDVDGGHGCEYGRDGWWHKGACPQKRYTMGSGYHGPERREAVRRDHTVANGRCEYEWCDYPHDGLLPKSHQPR